MKKSATVFLQGVLVLIGVGMLAFLIWEPTAEGVNANATSLYQIYFDDPFLAYIYLASIPFFIGLYQAIRILGYAAQNNIFSQAAVNAVRTIKYCACIVAAAIIAADIYIRLTVHGDDDPAGALMLGMICIFISVVIAIAASVVERILQNAVEIKSENELTV